VIPRGPLASRSTTGLKWVKGYSPLQIIAARVGLDGHDFKYQLVFNLLILTADQEMDSGGWNW
jgi:hypothetical protein